VVIHLEVVGQHLGMCTDAAAAGAAASARHSRQQQAKEQHTKRVRCG
jgi:hypothetical protein